MPREFFSSLDETADLVTTIREMNDRLQRIGVSIGKVQGFDADEVAFRAPLTMGGQRIQHVGTAHSETDAVNVRYLRDRSIVAEPGAPLVADRVLEARGGVRVHEVAREPFDLVPLTQLEDIVDEAVTTAVSGAVSTITTIISAIPIAIPGEDGEPGLPGPPGAVGVTGATGSTGAAGIAGATGPQGPPGLDGLDGEPGPPGRDGASGSGGGGSFTAFDVDADSGTAETIVDGNTLSILGGTGLSSVVSATDTITINLDNTAVTPGAYTSADITVDAQGRITSAANGSGGGGMTNPIASGASGTLWGSDTTLFNLLLVPNNADTTGKVGFFDIDKAAVTLNAFGNPALNIGGADPLTPLFGAAVSKLSVYGSDLTGAGFNPFVSIFGDQEPPMLILASWADAGEGPAMFSFNGRGNSFATRTPSFPGDLGFQFIGGCTAADLSIDLAMAAYGFRVCKLGDPSAPSSALTTNTVPGELNFAVRLFEDSPTLGAAPELLNYRADGLIFFGDSSTEMWHIDTWTQQVGIVPYLNSYIGLAIKGKSGQTADLQQWRTSADATKTFVDAGALLHATEVDSLEIGATVDPLTLQNMAGRTITSGTSNTPLVNVGGSSAWSVSGISGLFLLGTGPASGPAITCEDVVNFAGIVDNAELDINGASPTVSAAYSFLANHTWNASPSATGTVTITNAGGFRAHSNIANNGETLAITNYDNFWAEEIFPSTNATITNAHGLRMTESAGAGVVVNLWGVKIEDQTAPTTKGIGFETQIAPGTGRFAFVDSGGAPSSLKGKLTTYNNVTTAGFGVGTIVAAARATAQTAANTSVATFTPGTDGTFLVSANVLVTTATTHNFTVTCDYTDEGNTARTLTFNLSTVAGVLATPITNVGGTVPYEGLPMHIRAKGGTAITIKTTGTFTAVVYNVDGAIMQIA